MRTGEKMHFLDKYKSFLKNSRGATAIEFAILALPFFGLILGIIQLGIIFLANQSLDSAVEAAAREIRTGQVRSTQTAVADFRTSICNRVAIVIGCDNILEVSVQSFDSISATTGAALFSNNSLIITTDYDTGSAGDVIVIKAAVSIPIIAGSLFGISNGSGGTRMSASFVFANENFADIASANGG